MWAFALTTFMTINPDQDYAHQMNIELLKKENDKADFLALRKKRLTNRRYTGNAISTHQGDGFKFNKF